MLTELNKCLICGADRKRGTDKCQCGFVFHPVKPSSSYDSIFDDKNYKQSSDYKTCLILEEKEFPIQAAGFGSFFVAFWIVMIIVEFLFPEVSLSFITILLSIIISIPVGLYTANIANRYFNGEIIDKVKEISDRQDEYKKFTENLYKNNKQELSSHYGKADIVIQISRTEHSKSGDFWFSHDISDSEDKLEIYRNKKIIMYYNKAIPFSHILDVSLDDETISTTIYTTEKTKSSDVIGRAIVGGLIAGNVGATIGGATADRHIKTANNESIKHQHVVNISISDIQNPLIRICFGDNIEQAKLVYSTILACKNSTL